MCKKITIQIDKIAGEYVATLWEGVNRVQTFSTMKSKCLEYAEAEAIEKWPQAVQVNGIDVTVGDFEFPFLDDNDNICPAY